MAAHRIRSRPPRDAVRMPSSLLTGSDLAVYLQDAAHTPGGHAPVVASPRTEGEVVAVLREASTVLPIGAQSSLTGGATPFGEWVLSLQSMNEILTIGPDRVRVSAGVALTTLEAALRPHGLFYPPTPTFLGALAGGVAATNAHGAATFKYGSTRDWIRALTVVLASGDVLDIERGQVTAHHDGYFEIEHVGGDVRRVPIPSYTMPRVAKCSAGFHAAPAMDLVDLFVGSEGTLGVITEVELRVAPSPVRVVGFATFDSERRALDLVGRLREASRQTWASGDAEGIDVAAIESMDRRCLTLLTEDGKDREHHVRFAPDGDTAILFQAELPRGMDAAAAYAEIGSLDEARRGDTPLVRLCLLLREHGGFDHLELALPGDTRRASQLLALREAVPMAVNHRIGDTQRGTDARVQKVAADMIVPFEHLHSMMAVYREGFERRGLDHALWGHASDGNIHANVIPHSYDDVRKGEEAILEFGHEVARLGGSPLAEHGVGRSPVKQELLRRLYGDEGIREMRRTKRALDPSGKLAPGVLFSP